jgi:hypothetical protein
MASLTADRVKHATLSANTVDTVTLGSNWTSVEIVNWGTTGLIYVSYDGSTTPADPTVAGDNFDVVGPNGGAITFPTPEPLPTVVKLKCASANAYSVKGF